MGFVLVFAESKGFLKSEKIKEKAACRISKPPRGKM